MSSGFKDYGVWFSDDWLYRPKRQKEERAGFQKRLSRVHQRELTAWCPCQNADRGQLYARLVGTTYHVAKLPGSGPLHSIDCLRFSPPPNWSGRGSYTERVVIEDDRGFQITFREPMTRIIPPPANLGEKRIRPVRAA